MGKAKKKGGPSASQMTHGLKVIGNGSMHEGIKKVYGSGFLGGLTAKLTAPFKKKK